MSNAEIFDDQNLAPIIDEEEEEKIKEIEKKENIEIPPGSFTIDPNDEIPDDDIRQMLFLFCVNENIPIHYKQLLGKVIKKQTYKKSEKLFIFNMIGYVWQKAKQEEDLTTLQKVIIVRKIHKLIFNKFDDQ
jgi:hypothetical protein